MENTDLAVAVDTATNTGMTRRVLLGRAGLCGAALCVAATAPAAHAQLFGRPGVDQQKKLGAQAAQEILQKYHEVHDKRADLFNRVGKRLVAALPDDDRKKWDFNFHVLDSKEVNAFALPGGPMFMFTGLYERLDTEDALAAVTGHEMTHVRKEHWSKAQGKAQERSTGLGVLLGVFHAGRAAQTVAGAVDSLVGLKYSRSEEDEADDGGLSNLVAAGYNPSGMLGLFYTLEKLSGNSKSMGGELLSDHPLTSQRIDHTKKRILAMENGRTFPAVTPLNYRSLV